jgi:hypothetical protein
VSAFVAHTAWHWTADRFDRLRQFGWPAVSAASIASAMRWAMAVLLVVGVVVWLCRRHKGHAAVVGTSTSSQSAWRLSQLKTHRRSRPSG